MWGQFQFHSVTVLLLDRWFQFLSLHGNVYSNPDFAKALHFFNPDFTKALHFYNPDFTKDLHFCVVSFQTPSHLSYRHQLWQIHKKIWFNIEHQMNKYIITYFVDCIPTLIPELGLCINCYPGLRQIPCISDEH